jgi:galactokinase
MTDTATAEAPGRVNLIGEHTDYHHGYVLPTPIPQRTRVRLRARRDRRVRVSSTVSMGKAEEYVLGEETPGRGWLDYVQGVTTILLRHTGTLDGFDLEIDSSVPVGAGVSSSAALEISVLRGLRQLFGLPLDDLALARIGQAAEVEFVGAPVGIMDQMACSLGRDGEALFIDTRTLTIQRVPLPPSLAIVVIDSGVTHAHASGEYVTRRRESFEAAALLGVRHLRDVNASKLTQLSALPDVLARRARHIVTENARVLAAVEALRVGDVSRLGLLFTESHASMKHDYEITTPEVDALVDLAVRDPDVIGARLTGGGFGGAVVMLVKAGTAPTASARICGAYRRVSGRDGTVLVPKDSPKAI